MTVHATDHPRTSAVPALVVGLLDNAAIFPPGNAPMDRALVDHDAHLRAPHAGLVGPFLCSEGRWAELEAELQLTGQPLDVSVTVPGGAPSVEAAVTTAAGTPGVRLVSLEVPVSGVGDDPKEVSRAVAAFQAHLPDGVLAFVEVPRGADRDAVLDRLAGTPYRVKLRTGGTAAGAFPDEAELAAAVSACVRRGLPFKLTAGLHNALRHRDPATGFEHHGFLNVMLATSAALDRGSVDDVARLLAVQDPDAVTSAVRELTPEQVAAVRGQFVSFGTCSIDEPVADLVALGLLTMETAP